LFQGEREGERGELTDTSWVWRAATKHSSPSAAKAPNAWWIGYVQTRLNTLSLPSVAERDLLSLLQVGRGQTSVLCDSGKNARTEFLVS
jgi:hypothetical protein